MKNKIKTLEDRRAFMPEQILSRWNPGIHAANVDDESTINIYDIIGQDWWTGQGVTAKLVAGVLRKNKGKAVTVNINSPGGDYFEGLAIYNLLREHDGDVTVRVIGLAASAASLVAMAGDTIKIAEAGFFMIHNAWSVVLGNTHDMEKTARTLAQFDDVQAETYAKRTGMDVEEIALMLNAETWISGSDAVEQGFASQLLDSDELTVEQKPAASYNSSRERVDSILAQGGVSRSERRRLIKDLSSTPGAAAELDEPVKPGADKPELVKSMEAFINKVNSAAEGT